MTISMAGLKENSASPECLVPEKTTMLNNVENMPKS
jgi:hypothetical protein